LPIELDYENMSAVPKEIVELHEETDGRAVLTGVTGLKTQADVGAGRTLLANCADRAAYFMATGAPRWRLSERGFTAASGPGHVVLFWGNLVFDHC